MKQQGENPTDNQLGAGLPARAAAVAVNGSLLENTSGASEKIKNLQIKNLKSSIFFRSSEVKFTFLVLFLDEKYQKSFFR